MGDAASIGYYRVFKKKRDEFVEEVVFRPKSIRKLGNELYHRDKTPNERAYQVISEMNWLSKEIRKFSSLLEERALQVEEIVSSVKGNEQRFNTAFSLCCRSAELPSVPVVKNKKTFNELFRNEHQFIQTVEENFTSLKASAEGTINRALNDKVYADRDRVKRSIVKDDHALAFSNFDMARTELSNVLRDYRKLLEGRISD